MRIYNAGSWPVRQSSGKAYRISGLVSMLPLNQRGVPDAPLMQIKVHNTKRSLVSDGKGNMIPVGPGECIPLPELPSNHVAREYVERRGYDVNMLWPQFRASYCFKETPEDRDQAVYYKTLVTSYKNTPESRIVSYAHLQGKRLVDRSARSYQPFNPNSEVKKGIVWR